MDMQWTVPTKLTQQVIDFQKATFKNSFEAMALLQNQAERIALSLEYSMGIPEEGQTFIDEWIREFKQIREQYKQMIIQGFEDLERFIAQREQGEVVKETQNEPAKKVEVKAAAPTKNIEPETKETVKQEAPKSG